MIWNLGKIGSRIPRGITITTMTGAPGSILLGGMAPSIKEDDEVDVE